MKSLIIFMINPILYVLYRIINYRTFLKEKKEYLFALSLSIINTYIPYNAGDSVRYAFKYYELMLYPINEAWENYLPHSDYLYYGVLFIFSRLRIPYNIFIIFITFIMFYIILSLLKNIESGNKKFFYFLLLYMPIDMSLTMRYPLASYIMIYAVQKSNNLKKIILIILSMLIHRATSVIFMIYFFNKVLYKNLKLNLKIMILLVVLIINIFYFNLNIINKYFNNSYLLRKIFFYSQNSADNIILEMITSKLGFIWIFIFIAFIIAYIYLLQLRKIRTEEYSFLLIFGGIIISSIGLISIPHRFCWIFNIFFVAFILKSNLKKNFLVYFYKFFILCHTSMSILIIVYYSSFFYIKNYKSIPQNILPTMIQIIGINNKYNEKIKKIAEEYPEKESLGQSIMPKLQKYYIRRNKNDK